VSQTPIESVGSRPVLIHTMVGKRARTRSATRNTHAITAPALLLVRMGGSFVARWRGGRVCGWWSLDGGKLPGLRHVGHPGQAFTAKYMPY
jgi:hypothetical protein